jgi:hypothetical protein
MLELLSFLKWLVICVIATEATTEILVDSKVFEPLRSSIRAAAYPEGAPPPDTRKRKLLAFLDALTSCGYCLSVWVAQWFAILLPGYPGWPPGPFGFTYITSWLYVVLVTVVLWQAYGVFIHRLSNLFHETYMIWRQGRIKTHDVALRVVLVEEQQDG